MVKICNSITIHIKFKMITTLSKITSKAFLAFFSCKSMIFKRKKANDP